MKFSFDHDLHIHTYLSNCSGDITQTPVNILNYAKKYNLNTICVTDHYWDDSIPYNTIDNSWYQNQNFEHISKIKPLPNDENIRFLFGCEVEMGSNNEIAMPEFRYNYFDFIIVSTTHFHLMTGKNWDNADKNRLVSNWINRFDVVLNSNLPFNKLGLSHLVTPHIYRRDRKIYLEIIDLLPTNVLKRLFSKASQLGVGIELNSSALSFFEEEKDVVLRPLRIANECGCKFYLGSDSHKLSAFENIKENFEDIITSLDLTEDDKFIF